MIDVAYWHIASFRCAAEFGRYRGIVDSGKLSARQIDGFTAWLAGRQKRNQHWNAPAVKSICVRAELIGEEAFFHAGLLPHAQRDQHRAEHRGHCSNRNTRCQHSCDQPGIDRVAHKPVWTGVNDPMAFLARDRVRPKTSEMNSRPPRERDPRQGQGRKHVGAAVAKLPERFLSQHLRGPGRK